MDRRYLCLVGLTLGLHANAELCPPPLTSPVKIYQSHFAAGGFRQGLEPQPDAAFGPPPGGRSIAGQAPAGQALTSQAQSGARLSTPSEPSVLRPDPGARQQRMMGFGGAMTEACAINMMKLTADLRAELLEGLFSKTTGAGFDYVRLPIGASDFSDPSRGPYTYDDSPGNRPDPEFRHFDMSRDQKSFDLLEAAQHINPALKIIASPWSPPAWMKTTKDLRGGSLNPAHYGDYARYLVRVVREYRNFGLHIDTLSIQNEPGYSTTDYPTMGMTTSEQIRFTRDFLKPELRRQGVSLGILVLDHNYNMYADVNALLGDLAGEVRGTAYHCYEGNFTDMASSIAKHPTLPVLQTECTNMLADEPEDAFPWWMGDYTLAASNIGAAGSLAWNLCLDQTGGPHDNGCYGCAGLATTDFSSLEPRVTYSAEYYALAQVSRFLKEGAQHISVLSSDDEITASGFINPDGGLTLVGWNGGVIDKTIRVERNDCEAFDYVLPAQSAATWTWQEPASSALLF